MSSTRSAPVTPSFIPRIASQASPIATASPWRRRPYPPDFSIAWPMVCPRLRILRSEVSLSSRSTTDALNATARRTTQRHSSPESPFHSTPTARSRSHNSGSPARAHLTTSRHPRAEVAIVEGPQEGVVDEDRPGLVERPDEVLPLREVEAGLSAHAAVHLGKEGRGHLDAGDPPKVRRGGESGEVADDPAAEGDDEGIPPGVPARQEPVDLPDRVEVLMFLPRGEGQDVMGDPREPPPDVVPVNGGDVAVGHHVDGAVGVKAADPLLEQGVDLPAEEDVVGTVAQGHRHRFRVQPARPSVGRSNPPPARPLPPPFARRSAP